MEDSKQRFSNRVDRYARYRPSYPVSLIDSILDKSTREYPIAADIGSGTGIFTRLLLERGCRVYAVEPNEPMRAKAEQELAEYSGFESIEGQAENTSIPDRSVDLVACAQAFHWFANETAAREFDRILRDGGFTVLIWNERKVAVDAFHEGYEDLLHRFSSEYTQVDHRNIDIEWIEQLFCRHAIEIEHHGNHQFLDWEGLKGRLESSSYFPLPQDPRYEPSMNEFYRLYQRCQINGMVRLEYDTVAYFITVQ